MPVKVDEDAHIFQNYSFEHTYPPQLPITQFQNEVLSTIESNSVTVIQGKVSFFLSQRLQRELVIKESSLT